LNLKAHINEEAGNLSFDSYVVFECLVSMENQSKIKYEGNYFVVEDPKLVKITKVHLFFGRTRNRFRKVVFWFLGIVVSAIILYFGGSQVIKMRRLSAVSVIQTVE